MLDAAEDQHLSLAHTCNISRIQQSQHFRGSPGTRVDKEDLLVQLSFVLYVYMFVEQHVGMVAWSGRP